MMGEFRGTDGDSGESRSEIRVDRLARDIDGFEQVLDARQLATSFEGSDAETLVSGDNRKKGERKVEGLLCHRLSVIVLEVVEKKNFGCAKVNSNSKKLNLSVAASA
jgi:hypothetical protein